MLLNQELLIFEEFLKDYKIGLTGSFIAKKKNLNQKTTSNYLKYLEEEQILKSKIQGKNKLYFLNLENFEIVKNFIIAIEHLRTINFYKRNLLIGEISKEIQPFINGIGVIFGSYAKNNQKQNSDLDLLVIGNCNENEIEKISKIYSIDISLKVYDYFKYDILVKEVVQNHIIIKNTEHFILEVLNG